MGQLSLNYNPFIIGLGHRARHGKDTVAQWLQATFPGSKIYSFAEPLKAHLRVMGLMAQQKDGFLLQTIGTEIYRRADEDFWIKQLIYRVNDDQRPIVIVPDIRFRNEKAFVQQYGIAVKVVRRLPDGGLYIDPSRPADHPSEIELEGEPFDYTIEADSLKELLNSADQLAALIARRLAGRSNEAATES